MRVLREGGPPKLPAIGRGQMPRRRGGGLEGGGGEKKARRRPGSIARRAETPTEVREAAAKESEERQARQAKERGWDRARGRAKPRRGGQQRLDGGKGLQVNVEDANANADRREESEMALRLLDLQAEAHKAEMDLNKANSLSIHPSIHPYIHTYNNPSKPSNLPRISLLTSGTELCCSKSFLCM